MRGHTTSPGQLTLHARGSPTRSRQRHFTCERSCLSRGPGSSGFMTTIWAIPKKEAVGWTVEIFQRLLASFEARAVALPGSLLPRRFSFVLNCCEQKHNRLVYL